MNTIRYKTLDYFRIMNLSVREVSFEEGLGALAHEGWELVTAYTTPGFSERMFVFKRLENAEGRRVDRQEGDMRQLKITIQGPQGAGKTTAARIIAAALAEGGAVVVLDDGDRLETISPRGGPEGSMRGCQVALEIRNAIEHP